MSKYGWERGELTLPRAAIVPIRRAIIAKNNQIADDGLALAKKAWNACTAKEKKDHRAVSEKVLQLGARKRHSYVSEWEDTDASRRAAEILGVRYYGAAPRPPQKQNAGHLGSTVTSFSAGEAGVSFDSSSGVMSWFTGDNNHAVENAHDSWLGQVLFAELDKVKWTRRTGGWFTGNDEYNQDSYDEGRGQNYVTTGYGPVGAENHPMQTREYTMADGTRVTSRMLSEAQSKVWAKQARDQARFAKSISQQGRVGKGVSAGGQFASKANSAPSGGLSY